jgi:hypothetical protein
MNIVLDHNLDHQVRQKYMTLELDRFQLAADQEPVSAYALIEQVPLADVARISQIVDLHHNMIKNFRARNWKFCEDALEHLRGSWNGELDSFYDNIADRIADLKLQTLDDDWSAVIKKY